MFYYLCGTRKVDMARNYLQGKYTLQNKEKYVGDPTNIVFRSSWEKRFMLWADTNPNILRWNSEEVIVPYYDPSSDKERRYFVDFLIEFRTRDGLIKKALVEIKPEAQTKPPKPRTRITKAFIEETMTYNTNTAKWAYARKFCSDRGLDFVILTEKHLFGNKGK